MQDALEYGIHAQSTNTPIIVRNNVFVKVQVMLCLAIVRVIASIFPCFLLFPSLRPILSRFMDRDDIIALLYLLP